MKNIFYFLMIATFLTACSKSSPTTDDANVLQQNEDNNTYKTESDNLNNDINNVLNEVNGFKKTEAISICGATIDSSNAGAGIPKLVIAFDGKTTCGTPSKIRSGTITIELIQGKRWADKDAMLRVNLDGYKVMFPTKNNRSITISGVRTLQNMDGFSLIEIYTKGSLKFRYREKAYDQNIKFDDGSTAVWNSARQVEWTYTAATKEISVKVDGDSTQGTKKIDSWGTNRLNERFTNYVSTAWESNSTCGLWKPIKGNYELVTPTMNFKVTLGVDQTGKQISSGCAYGVSIDWNLSGSGKSGTSIQPYW